MPVFSPPQTNIDSVFTVGYLIDRTFDLLLGGGREELAQLTNNIDNVQTTFQVTFAMTGLSQGTYLCIDDEVMYVWVFTPSSGNSSTVQVQRGAKGSAAVAHMANAFIQINPPFPKYQIRRTLQDEIRSWGPQVFAVKSLDVPSTEFVQGYDLGTIGNFFSILDVREAPDDITGVISSQNWRSLDFDVQQNANKTAFPSGKALTITDPYAFFDTDPTLHIVYAAPFDVDTTFNDNDSLITMGLDPSEVDIPPYGAAYRLVSSREVRRTIVEAQGQVSDLQYYPPGYDLKVADQFKQLRDSRLNDAIFRLRTEYPVRRIV